MAKEVIRLYHKDELGNEYTQETSYDAFVDFGANVLHKLAVLLPAFIEQMGYFHEGKKIMMEPVTEDEEDFLVEMLFAYRNGELIIEKENSDNEEDLLS